MLNAAVINGVTQANDEPTDEFGPYSVLCFNALPGHGLKSLCKVFALLGAYLYGAVHCRHDNTTAFAMQFFYLRDNVEY